MFTNKNSNVYITSAIYSCFTFLCIFITFLSLVILHVFNPDNIPFVFLNAIIKLWAFVFMYFHFQYIICPTVIFLFFLEKLTLKTNSQYNQETKPCLYIKFQHYIFITAIIFALFINKITTSMP